MAGFFCWQNNVAQISVEAVNDVFQKLQYKQGKYLSMGEWNVMVFPKYLYDIDNWIIFSDGAIACCGTFAYKGAMYEQALPILYQDINSNTLDLSAFWGSFVIIAYTNNEFSLIRDGAALTRIFTTEQMNILSTSFSGIVECLDNSFTIDKDAVTELLTTGVITGNRTIIKEIKCITINKFSKNFILKESLVKTYQKPKNRNQAIQQQIDILKTYTHQVSIDWKRYTKNAKFNIGLTGGIDSRLLAILFLQKNKEDVIFHTHWRKEGEGNKDFKYAHIFANETNTPIQTQQITDVFDKTASEVEQTFYNGYCLSDGVIRCGAYWDESYSTINYRKNIVKSPYLRIMGFGGEQYRNSERIPIKSFKNLHSFVRWAIIYMYSGNVFKKKKDRKRIQQIILNNFLVFMKGGKYNLWNFKEYIYRVQSPDYRSLQVQMENRLGFSINPFLDTQVSNASKLAIPFLGKSITFQLDMMKQLSPLLASIPNTYGFDFTKREPLKSRLASWLWNKIPSCISYPIYARSKNYFRSNYILRLSEKFTFVGELEDFVKSLDLPIRYDKFRLVTPRSKLLLNLGYFIKYNENKINFTKNEN